MALFKIFKGHSENFGRPDSFTHKAKEGYAYFTPDDGKFYIDIEDNEKVKSGITSMDGTNRICINEGSIAFSNLLVLDCGTAMADNINIPDDSPVIETIYFECGDSSTAISENTIGLSCGNSASQITSNTIFYRCI